MDGWYGWFGWGGSMVLFNPKIRASISYVPTGMGYLIVPDGYGRMESLLKALQQDLHHNLFN